MKPSREFFPFCKGARWVFIYLMFPFKSVLPHSVPFKNHAQCCFVGNISEYSLKGCIAHVKLPSKPYGLFHERWTSRQVNTLELYSTLWNYSQFLYNVWIICREFNVWWYKANNNYTRFFSNIPNLSMCGCPLSSKRIN